jgi:hypothetical protein
MSIQPPSQEHTSYSYPTKATTRIGTKPARTTTNEDAVVAEEERPTEEEADKPTQEDLAQAEAEAAKEDGVKHEPVRPEQATHNRLDIALRKLRRKLKTISLMAFLTISFYSTVIPRCPFLTITN